MQSMREILVRYSEELSQALEFQPQGRLFTPEEKQAREAYMGLRREMMLALAVPDATKKDEVEQREKQSIDLFNKAQSQVRKYTELSFRVESEVTTTTAFIFSSTTKSVSINPSPLAAISTRISCDMDHKFTEYTIARSYKKKEAELEAELKDVSDSYGRTQQTVLVELQQRLLVQEEQATKSMRALNALVKHLPSSTMASMAQYMKEIIIEPPAADGSTKIRFTTEEPPKFDNGKFDDRYASNLVPQIDTVKRKPLVGALSCFSYTMSPRHAATAAILFRYFIKLNNVIEDGCPSRHPIDYAKENVAITRNSVNMKGYISACILYLFLEVDKSWDEIMKDPHNPAVGLMLVAKKNGLSKIQSKMERITNSNKEGILVVPTQASKPKLALASLSDKLEVREKEKSKLGFTGKYAGMFFMSNPILKTERYDTYLEKLYHRGATQDQLATKHDYDALHTLYQVKN